jgi:hypothetical protein
MAAPPAAMPPLFNPAGEPMATPVARQIDLPIAPPQDIRRKIRSAAAHSGRITKLAVAIDQLIRASNTLPSLTYVAEMEKHIDDVRHSQRDAIAIYGECADEDCEENWEAYTNKQADVEDRAAHAIGKATVGAARTHAALAAPPVAGAAGAAPAGAGNARVRPCEALRPDKLKRDDDPATLRTWMESFTAYFDMSALQEQPQNVQQQFFFSCLDSPLVEAIGPSLSASQDLHLPS